MANAGRWYEAVVLDLRFADTFAVSAPMSRAEALLWTDRFARGLPWTDGRRVLQAELVHVGGPGLLVEGTTQ